MRPPRSFLHEARLTLAMALPMTTGQLGQMLLGFSDNIMVGRVGVVPLAAGAFALSILNVLYVTGIGLIAGVSILAATSHGAGRPREAGEVLRHGLWLGTITGLGIIALLCGAGELWRHFGQPAEIVAMARPFLLLVGCSLLPALVWQCLKQYCEALSHAVIPMLTVLGGVALNVFLSWILIYGRCGAPALGLTGAGYATLITRILMAGALAVIVLRSPRFQASLPPRWAAGLSWRQLHAHLLIGVPMAAQLCMDVGIFAFAAMMMGWLGARALAAHQIAISYAATTFMFPLGISMAVSVRVGQAVGAEEWTRVRLIGLSGIAMAAGIMCLGAGGFLVFGHVLAGWFVRDALTVGLAARLLTVAGVFQIFDGTQIASGGALRGLKDMRVPTLILFVSYWLVALPICYWVGVVHGGGPVGIWWGLAVGLMVCAIALTARFLVLTRQTGGSPVPDALRLEAVA